MAVITVNSAPMCNIGCVYLLARHFLDFAFVLNLTKHEYLTTHNCWGNDTACALKRTQLGPSVKGYSESNGQIDASSDFANLGHVLS